MFTGLLRFFLVFIFCFSVSFSQKLPPEFNDQLVSWNWREATGFTFDENGRMFVWEKGGRVYVVNEGLRQESPVIDISEEVGNWRDHGLLGFALDPKFELNGRIYLLYAVDRHHLMNYGTASYRPDSSISFQASIGRLTRYTVDRSSSNWKVISESRKILIGDRKDNGIPLLHESHGMGHLVFGTDGSLLISNGDGSSYLAIDNGQGKDFGTYASQALEDGIIGINEDIGAFRAQSIHSLNGKILRIDPETGDGLPSNPFYDPEEPGAARSKVWALGFRNPFRMCLVPETGDHSPDVGDPGILYVGDNGWGSWEELDMVTEGGMNFGWPMYEGIGWMWPFYILETPNLDAPNPFFGEEFCEKPYFSFQDLFNQKRNDGIYDFNNPCIQDELIPTDIPRFVHSPPILDYNNQANPVLFARTFDYDSTGRAKAISLENPLSPIKGKNFEGSSSIGGNFYTGTSFPLRYRGGYFHADYGDRWINFVQIDQESKQPTEVSDFLNDGGAIVHVEMNPSDECLYYLNYPGQIRKICYGGNVPPSAILDLDRQYGPGPLKVQFSALASVDPEGDSLSYFWDFGDGSYSNLAEPEHIFVADVEDAVGFEVKLVVKDPQGDSSEARRLVSLNNTPPSVKIKSVADSSFYATTEIYYLPLEAQVEDQEFAPSELKYAWQVVLHHNTHNHPEPIDTLAVSKALISPVGCGNETYYYRINLEVTDPAGLSDKDEVILLPDCSPRPEAKGLTAEAGNKDVILSWQTETETGSKRFEIERKGGDFGIYEPILEVEAKGESNSITNYLSQDVKPYHGKSWYRLIGYNKYGSYAVSEEVELIFPTEALATIGPNPFREVIKLKILDQHFSTRLRIWNLLGQEISFYEWQPPYPFEIRVDLSWLLNGVYVYEIEKNGKRQRGKLIKE